MLLEAARQCGLLQEEFPRRVVATQACSAFQARRPYISEFAIRRKNLVCSVLRDFILWGGSPKPVKLCRHESLAWTQLQVRQQRLPVQLVRGQNSIQARRAEQGCSREAAHSSCLVAILAGRAWGEYTSAVCPYSTVLLSTPSTTVNTMKSTEK